MIQIKPDPCPVTATVAAPPPLRWPDPCPVTGRRRVTVAEWDTRPADLVDEYAYWFSPMAAADGLDPWRLIEGIDAHIGGRMFDVVFADGRYCTVYGDRAIYVKPQHYEALKCGN